MRCCRMRRGLASRSPWPQPPRPRSAGPSGELAPATGTRKLQLASCSVQGTMPAPMGMCAKVWHPRPGRGLSAPSAPHKQCTPLLPGSHGHHLLCLGHAPTFRRATPVCPVSGLEGPCVFPKMHSLLPHSTQERQGCPWPDPQSEPDTCSLPLPSQAISTAFPGVSPWFSGVMVRSGCQGRFPKNEA